MVMLKVVLGRAQHVADRLLFDGYKDEWLHRGSCQAKYKSQHTVDMLRSEDCDDIRQCQESC